jgi:hypothetical protein
MIRLFTAIGTHVGNPNRPEFVEQEGQPFRIFDPDPDGDCLWQRLGPAHGFDDQVRVLCHKEGRPGVFDDLSKLFEY